MLEHFKPSSRRRAELKEHRTRPPFPTSSSSAPHTHSTCVGTCPVLPCANCMGSCRGGLFGAGRPLFAPSCRIYELRDTGRRVTYLFMVDGKNREEKSEERYPLLMYLAEDEKEEEEGAAISRYLYLGNLKAHSRTLPCRPKPTIQRLQTSSAVPIWLQPGRRKVVSCIDCACMHAIRRTPPHCSSQRPKREHRPTKPRHRAKQRLFLHFSLPIAFLLTATETLHSVLPPLILITAMSMIPLPSISTYTRPLPSLPACLPACQARIGARS
ncbi:hypothetical protein B0T22DRAFT_72337 [Podospora appendiculata]|uniref:Uncharacterized protein n=1 Tax=Podospora appendiculata TaxID=314037 RepID=A0AAE0XKA0_9PEZI|nr:hypothetical protein B0T22DRAFT_72337 [Podospora appendiculata]